MCYTSGHTNYDFGVRGVHEAHWNRQVGDEADAEQWMQRARQESAWSDEAKSSQLRRKRMESPQFSASSPIPLLGDHVSMFSNCSNMTESDLWVEPWCDRPQQFRFPMANHTASPLFAPPTLGREVNPALSRGSRPNTPSMWCQWSRGLRHSHRRNARQ